MPPKWEGNVHAKLEGPKADQVWPLLEDYFNFHKWFPTLNICYGIEGANGEPGCIRYCAGSSIPSNGSDGSNVNWSTEKLVAIDPVKMVLTYEIIDGNVGFESYVSTIRLLPRDEDNGCVIECSFAVNPVKGWKLENLIEKHHKGLERMARRIEESIMSGKLTNDST
ncbi:hypothetical protein IFM89_039246 [Coptis chinensis]|uniref:Lachrymatory-factor synthase n=1 Tax=Coptis chinensis TaxID=261450 RepID=A0A835ILR5_9MAGN|nr:hypothetical protein IFM89_039246 [Coptis chinensis]